MEKRMAFLQKLRSLLQEKGVYVVLFVSLAVVAAAVAAAFWPLSEEEDRPEGPQSAGLSEAVGSSGDESLIEVKKTAAPLKSPAPSPIADFSPAPQKQSPVVKAAEKLPAPLSGTILWDFAMEELIYSVTLKQWMTHAGVDVESPKGTEVHAILGGTVEAVYEDDALGHVVLLSHSEERKSLYGNLQESIPVKVGDRVSAGDSIGLVGDSAPAECGMKAHLHFEFHKDGKPVDPKDYLRFES